MMKSWQQHQGRIRGGAQRCGTEDGERGVYADGKRISCRTDDKHGDADRHLGKDQDEERGKAGGGKPFIRHG